jgi:ABC-type antimicrobial peptide transport system permease subunit
MRALRIAALALAGLRRNPLRVVLTTLGVTIASGAIVSMVALALGVQRQVEAPFQALGLFNNITVKLKDNAGHVSNLPHSDPPNGDDSSQPAAKESEPSQRPDSEAPDPPPLDDAALARIEQLPGVAVAYPDVRLRGIKVRHGDKEENFVVGVALPRETALFGVTDEIIVAGRFFGETPAPEIILDKQLLAGLGFKTPQDAIGARVSVEATGLSPEGGKSFTFQRKQLEVTVAGVYQAPAMLASFAPRGIVLPVELMKEVPGLYFDSALSRLKSGKAAAPSYSSVTVRVRDPSYLASVEKELKDMGYFTRTVASRLQGMRAMFLAVQLLLSLVGTIAMAVAALGIINTLLMSVLERYQEIGICKAIGASDGDLLVLFLTEAGIIGLLGGLTGLLLGWLSSLALGWGAAVYARSQNITGDLNLFAFPPWLLAAAVAFAVVVSILAGIYPALRAARVDPIRALRSQ